MSLAVDPDRFPHFSKCVSDLKQQNSPRCFHHHRSSHRLPPQRWLRSLSFRRGRRSLRKKSQSLPTLINSLARPLRFPDSPVNQTRAWWGTLYKDFLLHGAAAGFWNDMNEPSVFSTPNHTMPDDVQHHIDNPASARAPPPPRNSRRLFASRTLAPPTTACANSIPIFAPWFDHAPPIPAASAMPPLRRLDER